MSTELERAAVPSWETGRRMLSHLFFATRVLQLRKIVTLR